MNLEKLQARYKYIRAYCGYMGSSFSWLEQQLWCAFYRELPVDTCFINNVGVDSEDQTYKVFSEYRKDQQDGISYYLNQ